jgi:hypothetical protein
MNTEREVDIVIKGDMEWKGREKYKISGCSEG